MKCPMAPKLLDNADMEEHLASCGECRETLAGQDALLSLLDEFETPQISTDFNRRLWLEIESQPARSWTDLVRQWLRPAIPLTAIAALLAVGFAFDHRSVSPAPPSVSLGDADRVERALDDMQLLTPFEKTPEGDPVV